MTMLLFLIICVSIMGVTLGLPTGISSTEESSENEVHSYNFAFVSRAQWQARSARERKSLSTPAPFVVIHHSYTPKACYSEAACSQAMRSMQNFHMDDRKWWDIGYNFGVGSDGAAYEGRGWDVTGAHALHFNDVSVGICLIGDWSNSLPPAEQIKTTKALIGAGVQLGYIKSDYKLVGHRQVRDTACPGETLYQYIKTWDHYSEHPSSVKELKYVEELPQKVKDLLTI